MTNHPNRSKRPCSQFKIRYAADNKTGWLWSRFDWDDTEDEALAHRYSGPNTIPGRTGMAERRANTLRKMGKQQVQLVEVEEAGP